MNKRPGPKDLLFGLSVWLMILTPPSASAFSDGSGYQILLAVQGSISELKKQLQEIKRTRNTLEEISSLNSKNARSVVTNSLQRYQVPTDSSFERGLGLADGAFNDRPVEALSYLQKMVADLEAKNAKAGAATGARSSRLLELARTRIKRTQQERLIQNHSLSDRQARDVQSEMLLELLNYERDRQEQRQRQLRYEKHYQQNLRRFLY